MRHPILPPLDGFECTGHYRNMAKAVGSFATAKELVRLRLSLDDVHEMHAFGRIDSTTYRWFSLAHEWTAQRFSSGRQGRMYRNMGAEALARRIARARKLFGIED